MRCQLLEMSERSPPNTNCDSNKVKSLHADQLQSGQHCPTLLCSCSMRKTHFCPMDGTLVHHRLLPAFCLATTTIHSPVHNVYYTFGWTEALREQNVFIAHFARTVHRCHHIHLVRTTRPLGLSVCFL